jgi:hypothetical protein
VAERPRVTVLMPAHNAERYLPEAIGSILAQDLDDFELLVVDDASTDDSRRYLESVHDPRLRVVTNLTNEGVTAARQRGLSLARGEYMASLDADDVALPGRLRHQANFLDAHPDVAVVGAAFEVIDAAGRRLALQSPPADWLTIRWKLLFGNCIANSAAMFRRAAAIAVGGYDRRVSIGEDYDLWVRLVAGGGQVAQLRQPVARWRIHPNSFQARASVTVKHDLIATVVRSIAVQTGRRVPPEIAWVLYRDQSQRTPDSGVLAGAYRAITECADYFVEHIGQTPDERRRLVVLALEDVFRLARRHPASLPFAWRTGAALARRHDPALLRSGRFVGLAAREVILSPARARLFMRRLRRPLPV